MVGNGPAASWTTWRHIWEERNPQGPTSVLRILWVCPKSLPTLLGQVNYLPKNLLPTVVPLATSNKQKLWSQKPWVDLTLQEV